MAERESGQKPAPRPHSLRGRGGKFIARKDLLRLRDLKGRSIGTYTPEIARSIVERLAEGETLTAICRDGAPYPHPTTFYDWVRRYPELRAALNLARETSAHFLEEEALEIARQLKRMSKSKEVNGTQVRALEVAMNQLRWSAERRNAAAYGTKSAVSIQLPIQINTTLDLAAGGTGTKEHPDIYELTATNLIEDKPDGIPVPDPKGGEEEGQKDLRLGAGKEEAHSQESREEKPIRESGGEGGVLNPEPYPWESIGSKR